MIRLSNILLEVRKDEIEKMRTHFLNKGSLSNNYFQFFIQPRGNLESGEFFRYDLKRDKYKKYTSLDKFLRDAVMFEKRGW